MLFFAFSCAKFWKILSRLMIYIDFVKLLKPKRFEFLNHIFENILVT